jgi:ATP phosphoribosyltransferase
MQGIFRRRSLDHLSLIVLRHIRCFGLNIVTNSRGKKYILMNLPADKVDEAIAILPAMRSPSVMPLADKAWCSLHSVVKADELWHKIERLKQIGAEGILVLDLDKVIE